MKKENSYFVVLLELLKVSPSEAALLQHCKRVTYQGGHVWRNALIAGYVLPEPSGWGWWKTDGTWLPYWTDILKVSKVATKLVSCKCKKSCSGRCKMCLHVPNLVCLRPDKINSFTKSFNMIAYLC